MSGGQWDPLSVFRSLDRHGVRFVVIGGLGGRLHGSPTVTRDTDICYERSPENLERLADTLRELDVELRVSAKRSSSSWMPRPRRRGLLHVHIECRRPRRPGHGVGGFDDLAERAEVFDLDGLESSWHRSTI